MMPPVPPMTRGLATRAALLAGLAAMAPVAALRAEEAAPPAGCEVGTEAANGLCVSAGLIVDTIGNATGGVRAGVAAIAQLRLAAHLDFEKMLGMEGWSAQASAFGIDGRQPTPTLVGSLEPFPFAMAHGNASRPLFSRASSPDPVIPPDRDPL